MKTIKQYAEEQGVSYEAIRKQISTYKDELKEHIVIKGRTQYLDDWAVNFLTERRKENPVIIVSQEKADEVEAMRKQIETLQTQLLLAQNALIQNQKDMIKDKETIIGLQAEAQKALEESPMRKRFLAFTKRKKSRQRGSKHRFCTPIRSTNRLGGELPTPHSNYCQL